MRNAGVYVQRPRWIRRHRTRALAGCCTSPVRISPFFNPCGDHSIFCLTHFPQVTTKGPNLATRRRAPQSAHAVGFAASDPAWVRRSNDLGARRLRSHTHVSGRCRRQEWRSSTITVEPQRASRPFDADREGSVMARSGFYARILETRSGAAQYFWRGGG